MANISTITGLTDVLKNMQAKQAAMAAGCNKGLRKAGLLLQGASQKLVPVEFGILKASAFTRAAGTGFNTVVIVGYTAKYALYVHELVGMKLKGQARTPNPPHKGKYWDPQGRAQAKFLEAPARAMRPELSKIIEDAMKTNLFGAGGTP